MALALTFRSPDHFNEEMLSRFKIMLMGPVGLVLFFSASLPAVAQPAKPDPIPMTPPKGHVPEALVQLGSGRYFSPHAFVMDKANRTLTVWKQDGDNLSLVTAAAADFGRNSGNKVSTGDFATPEGIYFFQQQRDGVALDFQENGTHPVSAFTLDYPNFFDVRERKSGSGIWLHTIPDQISLLRGSRGCVVVRSDVFKNLSPFIALKKTPILIQNSVRYLSLDEANQQRSRIQTWLNSWREAWQSKDLDQYIKYYDDTFKALGMSRAQWRDYKRGLSEKYGFIKVQLSEPVVLVHHDQVVMRFLQDYQSDKNADFGEKELYLKKSTDQYRILSEEWQATRREDYADSH